MHYYQFNISDYKSHTEHLSDLEDLAYRRMLDWCYLHESPLPKDKKDIARLIRMRSHSDCIAIVLREFFTKDENGDYINKRVFFEINKVSEKSSKARESAKARWAKASGDANALRTTCDSNATQDPRPKTHNPRPKKKRAVFVKPSFDDVHVYCNERNNNVNPQAFLDHYESNGWKVGKNKMKSWKACVRTWENRDKEKSNGKNQQTSRASRVHNKLKQMHQDALEREANEGILDNGIIR